MPDASTPTSPPERMRVRFWGVRGSIPTPSPDVMGIGGNTACVEVMGDRPVADLWGVGSRVSRRLAAHGNGAGGPRPARVGDVQEAEPLAGAVGVDDRATVRGDGGDLRGGRAGHAGVQVRGDGREPLEGQRLWVRDRGGGRSDEGDQGTQSKDFSGTACGCRC